MIVRSRGGQVQLRTTLADLGVNPLVGASDSTGGVRVAPETASGVPAVGQAVRLAAEAVACLEMGVWRGQGGDRSRVASTWQARFLSAEPNDQQTTFGFWETVEESLTYRGNAYVWVNVDPVSGRAAEWFALHPDQVLPVYRRDSERVYQVAVAPGTVDPVGKGYGFYQVDERTMLHIRGAGNGGYWIAPSPVAQYRQAIGAALAKIGHEANMWAKGASSKLAITFPPDVKKQQLDDFHERWKATYEGPGNAGRTAILGGGAQIMPISLSQVDAQFIESSRFSVEEIARIFNVPASLLDQGGPKAASGPITPEHEMQRWLRYGLEPRLRRIESAVQAFPPFGFTRDYPMFDSEHVVRGDLATEDAIAHQQIQDGRLLPDEWRAMRGLPPLPDGVGMIPQIVPVGGAPNPVAQDVQQNTRARDTVVVRAPDVHLVTAPINVALPDQAPPIVNVRAADQPAPIVNVTTPAPVVNVSAPNVNVAPLVSVAVPDRQLTLTKDASGALTGATIEAVD